MSLLAQVESLVVELDDLAVRQGEEEARRHQKLIDEMEELRTQLIIAKQDTVHMPREGQFDPLKNWLLYGAPALASKTSHFVQCVFFL
jgi:hypothetical protein